MYLQKTQQTKKKSPLSHEQTSLKNKEDGKSFMPNNKNTSYVNQGFSSSSSFSSFHKKTSTSNLNFFPKTKTLVALFGTERSTETLIEKGIVLSEQTSVATIHLTEVPEQTDLKDIIEETAYIKSIKRRIESLEEKQSAPVFFEPFVSHNIYESIYEISQKTQCRWLLTEWGGKTRWAFTFYNPISWLRDHLPCHIATFKDNGMRSFKKVLVLLNKDEHDPLNLDVAENFMKAHNAEVTICCYVLSKKSKANYQKHQATYQEYLDSTKKSLNFNVKTRILSGKEKVHDITNVTSEFDLCILTQYRAETLTSKINGTEHDHIIEASTCSVIGIQKKPILKYRN